MKIKELFEGEVAKAGPSGAKRITMTQAFGSPELAAIEEAGIKLTEKPDSWEAFEEGGYAASRNISKKTLKKIDNILGILPTYTGKEIFGTDVKPRGALADATFPAERMFIVAFDDGTQYLVDTTGARSYIRFWQKIV